MRRTLLGGLLLAGVLAAVSRHSYHARAVQPERSTPVPQAATSPESIENCESAIESANTISAAARESLPTETRDLASASELDVDTTPVRVEVLYAGSGRPVRAAKVSVGPPLTEGSTDERGVVELQIPAGSKLYSVRVNASDDGDPFVPYMRILAENERKGDDEIPVRVDRGNDLRGILRAAVSGAALRGANVTYGGPGYRTQVVSDADGAFLCQALLVNVGNPLPLKIECDGYLPSTVKPDGADLEPGAPPRLILLETGIIVSGRVFDPEHKPIAGADLSVFTPEAFRAVSDEQGFFSISGMKPSEHASLYAQTQSWSRPPILERSLDLGALSASRFDLEFEVQRAVEVRVFAELPDGSSLASSNFEVDWGDGTLPMEWEHLFPPAVENSHIRVLPLGRDLELRGTTRARGTDDRRAILRGSARIHTGAQSPLEAHIRLDEPGLLEIPPLPAGAGELELGNDLQPLLGKSTELLGALDVQVFDAESGRPIEEHNGLVMARMFGDGRGVTWLSPGPGGWLRIWHNIGARTVCVRHNDGRIDQVTISIPHSGYAKAEWRLSSKP